MKKTEHMPLFGVGPLIVVPTIILTCLGVFLTSRNMIPLLTIQSLAGVIRLIGAVAIGLGLIMYILGAFLSRIDDSIRNNELKTDGIFAFSRNPIYTAIIILCTGVILFSRNLALLVIPLFGVVWARGILIRTEEKWLEERFGDAYRRYCQRVNRFVTLLPKKRNG